MYMYMCMYMYMHMYLAYDLLALVVRVERNQALARVVVLVEVQPLREGPGSRVQALARVVVLVEVRPLREGRLGTLDPGPWPLVCMPAAAARSRLAAPRPAPRRLGTLDPGPWTLAAPRPAPRRRRESKALDPGPWTLDSQAAPARSRAGAGAGAVRRLVLTVDPGPWTLLIVGARTPLHAAELQRLQVAACPALERK